MASTTPNVQAQMQRLEDALSLAVDDVLASLSADASPRVDPLVAVAAHLQRQATAAEVSSITTLAESARSKACSSLDPQPLHDVTCRYR